MVSRAVIECISCESKTLTRTQLGYKDRQKHSFQCPTCGVPISFEIDLSFGDGKFAYDDPKDGRLVTDRITDYDELAATLTFSDDIPIPLNLPDMITPHIATFRRYEDFESYRSDEGLRQRWVQHDFEYAERCRVHFSRGNWDLFDGESPSHHEGPVTARSRLIDLYNFYTAGFSKFTLSPRGKYDLLRLLAVISQMPLRALRFLQVRGVLTR